MHLGLDCPLQGNAVAEPNSRLQSDFPSLAILEAMRQQTSFTPCAEASDPFTNLHTLAGEDSELRGYRITAGPRRFLIPDRAADQRSGMEIACRQ
jgi:hypothetical protein